jgi:hypothetical protein
VVYTCYCYCLALVNWVLPLVPDDGVDDSRPKTMRCWIILVAAARKPLIRVVLLSHDTLIDLFDQEVVRISKQSH